MSRITTLRLSLDHLTRGLFHVVSRIYSYGMHRKLLLGLDFFYSHWIAADLLYAGKGFVAHYPITMIGGKHIRIGDLSVICKHAALTTWDDYYGQQLNPSLCIGQRCDFGEYLHISCCNRIEIGDDVLTGRWVTIVDNSHGDSTESSSKVAPAHRPIHSNGPIYIKDKVWIGDKVTILGGVTIGEGAIIAANSVVTHDIPAFSVAAGVPARIIKVIN